MRGRDDLAELIAELSELPHEALVLMDSHVRGLDFVEGQGPGAPAEVILAPSADE
jgi:hypothetical protein